MDKEFGLRVLLSVLDSGLATRKSIAKELKIDPSQVSRIAAGAFRRMDGHALRVCKYAHKLQARQSGDTTLAPLATDLNEKVAQIVSINPDAAKALSAMLSALIDQWATES